MRCVFGRYGLNVPLPAVLASGVGLGAALIAGCGGSSVTAPPVVPPSPPTLAGGGATTVYVVQHDVSGSAAAFSILQLAATSNGSVSPVSTLSIAPSLYVNSVATDSSGQIYLGITPSAGSLISEVLIYAAGASGTAVPVRTVVGGAGTSVSPAAMAIDSSGSLYVVSSNAILVYPSTANGPAIPSRMIQGPLTQLVAAGQIAVDKSETIYTSEDVGGGISGTPLSFELLAFSSAAMGNVAPARVITIPTTDITGAIDGIDTDAAGDVYISRYSSASVVAANTYAILEFAPGATGNASPIKTISSTAERSGVRVDAVGNLYTVGLDASSIPYLAAYAPSSSGIAAPTITIASAAWTLMAGLVRSIALK